METTSSDLVSEALARPIAILDRREHRSEKEHKSVRILMVPPDGCLDQRFWCSRNLRHIGVSIKHETILALDAHAQFRSLDRFNGEIPVKQANERSDRSGGIVVLRLAEQQGRTTFDVPQIDIVSERCADDAPGTRNDEYDLRLRIVPARNRVQSDICAKTHRRHWLALGEDFRIRPDAHFQILAPDTASDQRFLHLHRGGRSGHDLGEVRTDEFENIVSQRIGLGLVAFCLFLDDAFQQRCNEGDTRRLYGLQIDRRKQCWNGRIEFLGPAVLNDRIDVAKRCPRCAGHIGSRIVKFGDIPHRWRSLVGDVEHLAIPDRDDPRMVVTGNPCPSDKNT